MKVKVAVTDACIFIDLLDTGLIASFFAPDIEVHTTSSVLFELFLEQRKELMGFQSAARLTVHNLQEQDVMEIQAAACPKSLSEADKSVYILPIK